MPPTTGFIRHIEVENFKSYKGVHTIPFTQFSSVIGPNGSGKSNLMDAISFVLGMKTQRLRSSNLRELVYKGPNENKPSATVCKVTLVYQKNVNQEQTFQRRIQVSSGTAKYEIDGREVTYEKYDEVLKEMGVIVSARNFLVFQGDVESIASKSPKELTAFIEKVSGSEEDKEEYEACRAEMEKAEDNTVFTFNKKKTINAERKQYKEQKEEAERYHTLQQDLVEMKKNHMLWQLFHIDRDIKAFAKKTDTDKTELAKAEGKRELIKKDLQEKSAASGVHKKAFLALEKDINKRKAKNDSSRPDAIKVKEEIAHVTKRLTSSRESLKKIKGEYTKQQTDLASLREKHEQLKAVIDKITLEEKQTSEKMKLSKAHLDEYAKIKDTVGVKTAENRKEVEALDRRIGVAQEQLARKEQEEEQLQREITQLKDTKKQLGDRAARLSELIETTKVQIKQLEADEKKREKEAAEAAASHKKFNEELVEIQSKLSEAKTERKESDRDKRFKEAIASMQRLFPSVRGRLVELTKPTNKKYHLAISVAMGKYMDAVVVEDERTARECIQYLKDQRVGTCTFLPLDSIRPKQIDEKLRSNQSAKFVLDLLTFEPFLHNAVLFAVGNTLVADDLTEARRLAFGGADRNRVVTLKGVLIQKSGLISGGSGLGDRGSRWDENEVDDLKKRRDTVLQKLATVARDMKSATAQQQQIPSLKDTSSSGAGAQTVSLANKVGFAQKDLEWTNDKLKKLGEEKKKKKAELKNKLEPEVAELKKKIAEEKTKADARRTKINEVTDEHFAEFCEAVGVDNIRQYEEERLSKIRERTERKVDISKQVASLQSHIDYESARDVKGPLDKLEKGIADDEGALDELKERNKVFEKQNAEFDKSLEGLVKQQNEAKKNMDDLEVEVKENRKLLALKEKEIVDIQKRLSVTETQVHQSRAKRHNLYQQARVEEIKLPLLSEKGKGKKGKGKKSKGKGKKRAREEEDEEEEAEEEEEEEEEDVLDFMDIDTEAPSIDSMNSQNTQGVANLDKEDAIELDFGNVKDEETSNAKEYDDKNAKQLGAMQDVEAKMANLAPNLKAVQRLDDVDTRLTKTNVELEDSRNDAKKSKEKFTEVQTKRKDKFMSAFKRISESIHEIYQELTRSNDHPNLHGAAYLHVENQDEPYLAGIKYTTMPPMKRFRDMEQLSGGEKTVAALALLFAAHTYRPSPFFILDEVDAALDSSNVQLVARYIRNHSKKTQFIVISLKDTFYDKSNALVGICRDIPNATSKAFTLDLRAYPQ